MILTTQWFGSFLISDGDIVDEELFPKDPEEIAKRLGRLQSQDVLDEEFLLGDRLSDTEKELLEGDDQRLRDLCNKIGERLELAPGDHGFEISLLQEATILLARESLSVEVEKDKHINQAINMTDELIKSKNVLCERLAEWYNIYFPEAVSAVDHDRLVEVVSAGGDRKVISKLLGLPELSEENTGSEVGDDELFQYSLLSNQIKNIDETLEEAQRYIKRSMEAVAPNLTALAGPNVGARLIALAGSLERLSRLPASTVQMLGAEKALFRFLKHKGLPPKHGIIFMLPLIHSAPYWQRGNIARTLASKISLAVKVDYHSGRDISEDLLEQVDRQVEIIRKKYPNPPEPKKSKKRKNRKKRSRKGKRRK